MAGNIKPVVAELAGLGLVNIVTALPNGAAYDHAKLSNGTMQGKVNFANAGLPITQISAMKNFEYKGKKIFEET